MDQSICIVGGCGHVGLPLGIFLAENGFVVGLLDINAAKVQEVNAGRMPFREKGADEALPAVLRTGRLTATTSQQAVAQSDIVIVTVGTPVDEYLDPSIRSFDQSMDRVLEQMRSGQLLVLRSTVFPGITERLSRRAAERGLEIDVVYCPERIVQGFALEELGKLPQIVGGTSPTATRRAVALFQKLAVKTVPTMPVEAELAKLFANAHRYITFALSNQFFLIAEKFGANFNQVREAVTAQYPRLTGFARAGFAGGPCLLKDTMQLAGFNHNSFALGQAAMMVNEGLPRAVVDIVKSRRDISRDRAAILGMAFKGNCDDPRSSLAYKLRKLLSLECAEVVCTDPYIDDPSFVSLDEALARADIVFIGACHDEYRASSIRQPLVDVFDFLEQGDHLLASGRQQALQIFPREHELRKVG
jgi:UDP-N-acetyl-D-mannosaminuronic acid dehydrogenase